MTDITRASVLAQIRALNENAAATLNPASLPEGSLNFGQTLKDSIGAINEMQQNASEMAVNFQSGSRDTSLVDVMLASQKASLSFHAATEVRNKLVNAYQEIMNMPV